MKPGIYYGMTWREYLDIEAWNPSSVKTLIQHSPALMMHKRANPDPPSTAMNLGSYLDALVMPPGDCKVVKVACSTRNTKAYREAVAENPDAIVLPDHEAEEVERWAQAIDDAMGGEIRNDYRHQVTLVWECPETGLLCKTRLDALHISAPHFADVKSARSVIDEDFHRQGAQLGYHISMGARWDGLATLTGDDYSASLWAVEKSPPYSVVDFLCDESYLKAGRDEWRKGLRVIRRCVERDEWPKRPPRAAMQLPAWMRTDEQPGVNAEEIGDDF